MHVQFNGSELATAQMFEMGDPQAVLKTLAQTEWSTIAREILPPEIIAALAPIANTLVEKFGSFIDASAERIHAEKLRQDFGEPQIPEAFPVANALTILLEEGFHAEIKAAQEAKSVMEWLRQQVRETILVWHLLQVSKHETELEKIDKVGVDIANQGAITQFAVGEAKAMTNALVSHKQTLKEKLSAAQKKLLAFTSNLFSDSLEKAERVVYQAPKDAVIPVLDPTKAIPVITTA